MRLLKQSGCKLSTTRSQTSMPCLSRNALHTPCAVSRAWRASVAGLLLLLLLEGGLDLHRAIGSSKAAVLRRFVQRHPSWLRCRVKCTPDQWCKYVYECVHVEEVRKAGVQAPGAMGEKRKHRKDKRHDKSESDEEVRHQVGSLKRRHQHDAVLAGDEGGTLFWSKKVEQDIKSGIGTTNLDSRELAKEREAELQRVRARRWESCAQ